MQDQTHKGFRPLFSEINPLFVSSGDTPNTIRVRIRMQGEVNREILQHAVDLTMKRYPYFCVRLEKKDGVWGFADNPLPVMVFPGPEEVVLNSEAANDHLIAFSCREDWLFVDTSHCLTDGTGIIELIRTLLYYYFTERYGIRTDLAGIRLNGDVISPEEWEDPAPRFTEEPPAGGGDTEPCLNPAEALGREKDPVKTVYSTSVDEKEFMRFNIEHDGSPATMIALFLSRAIADAHPDSQKPIRISLCVNQRKALNTPLAHQSLVGGAWLEYSPRVRRHPLTLQATMYRGMVMAQTREESVLTGLTYINRNTRRLLSLSSDTERICDALRNRDELRGILTATVSYAGRGNLGSVERYIREFHLWASAMNENILFEICAVNGCFFIDCIQNFSAPVYWNRFLAQLKESGIACTDTETTLLRLPRIRLPWIEQETDR